MVTRRPGWAEVWWTTFEADAIGRRPAVVLTRPEAVDRVPQLLVAPATRTVRNLPSEVSLDIDDGMPAPCVLNLDSPALVAPYRFDAYICTLAAPRWADVCQAMARAINC